MPEHNSALFPFGRVLVMDPSPLTGLALCQITDEVACQPCSEYVASLPVLHEALSRSRGERVLLIMELMSAGGTVRDGMGLLQMLQPFLLSGQYRVLVCTDLADPLLLRAVLSGRPSVLVLRREPLTVLREAISMADVAWPGTVLSPAVTDGLARVRHVKLAPREMEMLVTQVDYPDIRASAAVMAVSHKTVSTWRRNVMRQIRPGRKTTLQWRLAQMQKVTGRG